MLVDITHWLIAFLIALSVHLAGLLWFDPPSQSPPPTLDLSGDNIVVRLGTGSGRAGQLATLLNQPMETEQVKSVGSADTETPVTVEKPSEDDIKTPVEQVAVPQVVRRSLELETVESNESQSVVAVDPESEVTSVDVAVTAKPSAKPDETEAVEVVVAGPSIEEKTEVAVSSPVPTREQVQGIDVADTVKATPSVDETREVDDLNQVAVRVKSPDAEITEMVTAAPLVDEPNEVQQENPILAQAQRPTDSQLVMHSEPAPVAVEPELARTAKTEKHPESISLAAVVVDLEEIEEVTEREQSTAVTQPLPSPVQTPPREQVARAVTLEELQGGSGVSARYAGLLKGWLQENMHYPRAARLAGQEGRAIVRFVIDRSGKVLSIRLEQGSGHHVLDREAVEMIERADPFPVMPAEMITSELELRVPIVFEIHDESLIRQIPPIYLE
ncbi:MAG: TonB family protein [Arenicellales bacterium]|nr:TonB family protein [Arenicellales bacterium]